jgi:DnaJ-class molecular chaperone
MGRGNDLAGPKGRLSLFWLSTDQSRATTLGMKKPIEPPIERPCPACNGTGLAPTKPPARPGVRIFAQCKECGGKGRVAY